jgi:hypothetical protein
MSISEAQLVKIYAWGASKWKFNSDCDLWEKPAGSRRHHCRASHGPRWRHSLSGRHPVDTGPGMQELREDPPVLGETYGLY